MEKKFSRKTKPRKQMLRNLANCILIYEKVRTTEAKAKAVRSIVEKMINIGKTNNLKSRRVLLAYFMNDKNIVDKIINDIGPRFHDRKSGYLKIYKTQFRLGDNSKMVTVILAKSKFLGNNTDEKEIKLKSKTKK